MAIDKVLPRYLNKDDDDRLIKKVEMTDAQNVRVSSDEQGNGLVVKNAYGNEAVTLIDALPAGTNEVVGAIADEQAGEIFYFIWNSNNDHSIYRYTTALNTASQVCQDSVLEFSRDVVVQAEIVKNTNDDTLLYFNDGITAPKKINATKAIRNQYPAAFTTGTDDERLLFYTVAKQPPLTAPTFTFRRNPNIDTDIRNENFQFAYQYVYDDGEYSALSPYSELSVYPGQLKDGFIPENKRTYLNEIVVSVVPSIADVNQIRVFVRRGNEGTFYEVDTIDNSPTSTAQTVVFNSLKGLVPLGTLTTDKLYDNVPQIADSQTVAGNRLFYGGYTEGYDSIATSVETYQNLSDDPDQYSISVVVPDAYEKQFTVNYANLPNSFINDSMVFLNFFIDTGKIRIATFDTGTTSKLFSSYRVPAIDSIYTGSAVVPSVTKTQYVYYNATGVYLYTKGNSVDDDIAYTPAVVYNDLTNDTDKTTEQKPITTIGPDGINVLSSGLQVRIAKEIPAGTTKAQAISIIENEIIKDYPILIRPQFGDEGIGATSAGGFTPFTAESVSFQGKGSVVIDKIGYVSGDTYKYEVFFDNVTLEVAEFYNGSGNKVEVIETINPIKLKELSGIPTQYQYVYVSGFSISNAGSFASESINGYSSFKSGATHQLGIVYFDDRGRTSTVQKVPSLTVNHLSDRTGVNALDGHASAILRINHQPPSWANSWAPVYVGSGSINAKLQYTTSDAFASKNKETTEGNASGNRNIYVSFRGLSGKKNSYVESYNPVVDYDFSEGDKLRICYTDKAGDVSDYIFNIKGYTFFDSNEKNNPILNPKNEGTIFSTTGKFLILEDNPSASGFSYSDVAFGEHYWSANTVIEIYKESDADKSEIYYEMGTAYPIDNSATNKHGSQRPVGDLTNIDLNILSLVTLSGFGTVVPFATDKRVYSGDYVVETSNPNNVLRVVHSYSKPDGSSRPWRGMALLYGGSWSPGLHTTNVTNGDAAILELTQGDVYFRLRLLLGTTSGYTDFIGNPIFTLSAANNSNGIVRYIEDSNVSDFYKSINTSKGRPHLYMPNAARIKRSSSVTYSDPFSGSNNILGLSSFNLSLSNYYDFNKEHGSIKYLYGNDDIMYIIQERKVGQVAVSKNIIEFSDGTANITATRNVLSPINYYQGDYGVNGNPESVAAKNGSIFFCDVKSGKVIRLSRDGITPISEQLVDSYFKERFKTIIDNGGFKSIIGGIDVENKEYIVSTDAIYTSGVTITDGASEYVYEAQTDSSNTKVICPYVIDNAPIFKFGSDPRNFEDACDEWENSLDSIVFLDKLIDGDPVYVASSLAVGPTPISSNLYGVATNSNYDFFATITYDMVDGSFVFNNAYCTADASGSIGTAAIKLEAFTIAYNIDDKVWNTRYSYIPERIVSMNDTLFTFKSGRIYKHSDAANRNTYYGAGSPDNSIVEVVFNQNPSQVKFYKSLSLEGTNAWDAVISNSDQSTSISKASVTAGGVTYPYGDYEKLERGYFAEIPRDSSANSTSGGAITNLSGTSEVFGLGAVDSISGYNIVFTSDISYIPFPIGAALYKVSGSTLVSISNDVDSIVNNNTIACSNVVGGVSIGDEILVIANGAVEGDFIRDYYAKATLTNASATETELYAINAVYSESKLHNELGQ